MSPAEKIYCGGRRGDFAYNRCVLQGSINVGLLRSLCCLVKAEVLGNATSSIAGPNGSRLGRFVRDESFL
jgi:hypothetical protein